MNDVTTSIATRRSTPLDQIIARNNPAGRSNSLVFLTPPLELAGDGGQGEGEGDAGAWRLEIGDWRPEPTPRNSDAGGDVAPLNPYAFQLSIGQPVEVSSQGLQSRLSSGPASWRPEAGLEYRDALDARTLRVAIRSTTHTR